MATLGHVRVMLFAQVGDADQHEIGSVMIPLKAQVNGKGFTIDLEEPFSAVRAMVQDVFRGDES